MKKDNSIVAIAKKAGVSKTTVSLVLNGKAEQYRIGKATVERVQGIIDDIGYVPNEMARGLRLKKTKTLGLVVGDLANYFSSQIEKSVEYYARQSGYTLIIGGTNNDPAKEVEVIDSMLARSVDGLILVSSRKDIKEIKASLSKDIPIVFLDRKVQRGDSVAVTSSNRKGMSLLTEGLISKGYGDFSYLAGLSAVSTSKERLAGFKDALKKAGLPLKDTVIIKSGFSANEGEDAALKIFSAKQMPRTIICASYTIFEGLLNYLKTTSQQSHLKKIKIGVFDNHPLMDFLPFGVDSVVQDADQLGRSAVELLINKLEKNLRSRSVEVETTIIEREF